MLSAGFAIDVGAGPDIERMERVRVVEEKKMGG